MPDGKTPVVYVFVFIMPNTTAAQETTTVNTIWTDAEKKFIRENSAILRDAELAVALTRLCGRNITVHALRHIRTQLGIKKSPGKRSRVKSPLPPAAGINLRN
jgi:hypothetical protein